MKTNYSKIKNKINIKSMIKIKIKCRGKKYRDEKFKSKAYLIDAN